MRSSENKQYAVLYGVLSLAMISMVAVLAVADSSWRVALTSEDGPIEMLSATGYFVCGVMLLLFNRSRPATRGSLLFVLLAFGLREMDFHNSFTTAGITRLDYYTSGEIPGGEKLLIIAFVVLLVATVGFLIRMHARSFLQEALRRKPYAVGGVMGLSCMVSAKILDGFSRKLEAFGIIATDSASEFATLFEESLELGIPVMFLTGIMAHSDWFRGDRRSRDEPHVAEIDRREQTAHEADSNLLQDAA